MHHIEIYVRNLAKSREFYEHLFKFLNFSLYQEWDQGFSFKKDDFYIVFVQCDETKLHHAYNRTHIGLNHLAFHCNSFNELELFREDLIHRNINLLYEVSYPHAGGTNSKVLFFEDPDRIKIELVVKA